ncbi:winged helix-turn-helix transcriptional regulator [Streptomyces sp. NPDC058045]|uniref:winged helix-turn-helix transcriptional regulator n=1 Tax=Streptomyces sp. NPDC058045 TaxID=3346311 RepID=UPI0036EEA2AD
MPRQPRQPGRRSYDQFCAAARALDAVGDRWTLLIVRELLAGPRRYTDLHADLVGVSTDMLATRLRDMERDGIATRRRTPPPTAARVYELTERGRELRPVLEALGTWGALELDEPRPTDAVRAHWFALPLHTLLTRLGVPGTAEVRLPEGEFHLLLGTSADHPGPLHGDGPAPTEPDARLTLTTTDCARLADGSLELAEAVRGGRVAVTGEGALAEALRG